MSAEEVYEVLKKNGVKPDKDYVSDIIEAFNKLPKDEQDKIVSDIKQAVVSAAQTCQRKGQLPASIERLVSNLINPPIPWTDELRQYCTEFAKDDYSWEHPNRRYSGTDFALPSLRSKAMGEIVIAVDTSGSIDETILSTFLGCIDDIVMQTKPSKITAICCDATVQSVEEFSAMDTIKLKLKGGGGTSFVPVFNYIEKEGIEPAVLIYLTDTYGDFPKHEPSYPVIWATFGGDTVPFGRVLKVNI
jgi:predicted metal-dependent peptidase